MPSIDLNLRAIYPSPLVWVYMLSERRRLSDVATCRSASGDVMHCAGTAGHSTHERALDTVRHATGDPVSAMVNASISQVVLLYSVQPLSFSKTAAAKRELGRNEGTASVYATSACPQPREPRMPLVPRSHTRQLNPASHIAQPPRPSQQNPRTNGLPSGSFINEGSETV